MDPPKATTNQMIVSLVGIAIAIWFMGLVLGYAISYQRPNVPVILAAVAGPGLVIVQQYRATFHASESAARFCVGIDAILFCLLAISVLLANRLENILLMIPTWFLLIVNWRRYSALSEWHKADPAQAVPFRFGIVDLMLLFLAISLVLAIARSYAHL